MNVSYLWLKALAPTIEESATRIGERLGMLGAPVDEQIELGAGLEDLLIAKVIEVRPHPNADRLRLCMVDAGAAEPVQVVCGAPNVEAGHFYPFAPVGARLPEGIVIRKAKLRGESSEGMLCSARELGLGRDHTGLMTLTGEWQPGASFLEELALRDVRLVIDLTPNRSDLLSQLGVAREIAPGGDADLRLEPFGSGADFDLLAGRCEGEAAGVRVRIEDSSGCPRYLAAVIDEVEVGPSPEWLATRLRAIGARPINNVVDATNYVLHEIGQPLHAFDLDRLEGPEIIVRSSRSGESLETLDGVERELAEGTLVIADAERPVAIAGVMGGAGSEVTLETRRVLLECALFSPVRVRKTARSLGLFTDASHRFERGVDPEGQPRALRRVVDLILSIAGGKVREHALDLQATGWERLELEVRTDRVEQVLGVTIEEAEMRSLLAPIGFRIAPSEAGVRVEVPSYRPDVLREIDVIEEIARRRGYDSFDAGLGRFRPGVVPEDPILALERATHDLLARHGFLEALTPGFAPAREGRVPLLNPLSVEESHLRDQLSEGLVRRVEHNWGHGVRAVRLYEIGTVFEPAGGPVPREELRFGAVLTGPGEPPHWSAPARSADLWEIKGLAEEIATLIGGTLESGRGEVDDADGAMPGAPISDLYDPSEHFLIRDGEGRLRGVAGRIAPSALDAPAWADPLWGVEVVLPRSWRHSTVHYRPLPIHPGVERDLALLVPGGVRSEQIELVVRQAAGPLLERVWPFDLYEGAGLPEGVRSIAWRLRFRHPERTLVDAEVEASVRAVLEALAEQLDVRRR